MQSPGIGFPSLAAIVSAILYFLPLYITGIAASWIVVLFIIGLIFLLAEIFIIPGVGITGILGVTAMLIALVGGIADSFSSETLTYSTLWEGITIVGIGIVLGIILIIFLTSKYAPKFITRHSELQHSQLVEEGYIGVDVSLGQHVGAIGITRTDMRPGGKIEINGEIFDAVAMNGKFINEETKIIVKKFENSQLYIEIYE